MQSFSLTGHSECNTVVHLTANDGWHGHCRETQKNSRVRELHVEKTLLSQREGLCSHLLGDKLMLDVDTLQIRC